MLVFNKQEKEVFRDLFYKCGAKIAADHFNVDEDKVYAYAVKHHMFTRQRESYLHEILERVASELSPEARYQIERGSTLHRIIMGATNETIRKSRSKGKGVPD